MHLYNCLRKYAYMRLFFHALYMCIYKCIGKYIDFAIHLRKLVIDFHIISYLISFE